MKITEGSITTQGDGFTDERMLFTYSEEEKQQNEINESNAEKVFSPEFIPFYPAVQKQFDLTNTETLIYGFIRFYTSAGGGRFYFTDEQLGLITNTNERTAGNAVRKLESLKIIHTKKKVKSGGGTMRFVENIQFRVVGNIQLRVVGNIQPNKNNINNNKINKEKEDKEKTIKKEEITNELVNLSRIYLDSFNKNFKNYNALKSNYLFWRELYSAEEIQEAMRKSKFSEYWRDHITPVILLRQKDSKGNAVDRIGEFLALEETKSEYLRAEDF